jgi:hypothetical protein
MDQELRSLVGDLRRKSSREAADWLMDHYPAGSTNWGKAITILVHLSWKRAEQVRLANHYLSRLPFASAKPYEAFASFMRVSRLIGILRQNVPSNDRDRGLLEYHVGPVLVRAAKTPADHEAVRRFMSELKAT